MSKRSFSRLHGALAAGALALIAPQHARAHFVLQSPPSWMSQDVLGDPQKLGPCGSEPGGTPTGTVTAFQTGDTITITIREVIFHPGHYRVALAVNDRSELPMEPLVTTGTTACGSVPIQSPPVYPVLADGVLAHTAPFSGPQTIQVTIPPNITCAHCTLQIIEFMSQHPLNNPGGCFYHHCADISIGQFVADAGTTSAADAATNDAASGDVPTVDVAATTDAGPVDAGSASRDAAITTPVTSATAGCSCRVGAVAPRAPIGVLALGACAAIVRRRRRGAIGSPTNPTGR